VKVHYAQEANYRRLKYLINKATTQAQLDAINLDEGWDYV